MAGSCGCTSLAAHGDPLAWMFSDRLAGGMLAALRAALAFHAAHVAIDAAEGVAFGSIG